MNYFYHVQTLTPVSGELHSHKRHLSALVTTLQSAGANVLSRIFQALRRSNFSVI